MVPLCHQRGRFHLNLLSTGCPHRSLITTETTLQSLVYLMYSLGVFPEWTYLLRASFARPISNGDNVGVLARTPTSDPLSLRHHSRQATLHTASKRDTAWQVLPVT